MNEYAWGVGGMKMTGENRNTWIEACHRATLSTTKPKLNVLPSKTAFSMRKTCA